MNHSRKFVLAAIVALLALSSCNNVNQSGDFPAHSISHVVICYLKHPGNPIERQQLIDASKTLSSIPGIIDMKMGRALPSTRPVVVSDFDAAFIFTFKDAAALDAYQTNPRHLQAVKEVLEPLVGKLIIYDIVNQ